MYTIHFAAHQKPTQHCKSTTFQLKKKKNNPLQLGLARRPSSGPRDAGGEWWVVSRWVKPLGNYVRERLQQACCLHLRKVKVKSLTRVWLCDPMDCSPEGFSVHGIFQARVLEWVAIFFSRGSSWPRDWTQASNIAGRLFTLWATFSTFHPATRDELFKQWRGSFHCLIESLSIVFRIKSELCTLAWLPLHPQYQSAHSPAPILQSDRLSLRLAKCSPGSRPWHLLILLPVALLQVSARLVSPVSPSLMSPPLRCLPDRPPLSLSISRLSLSIPGPNLFHC